MRLAGTVGAFSVELQQMAVNFHAQALFQFVCDAIQIALVKFNDTMAA